MLYDGDGSILTQFDLTESARGRPLQVIKPPNAGDLLFGILYEQEAVFYRIRLEEIREKAAKRVVVKEEWTRQFSEYRTPFMGIDVQDIHIAKRAGRYISIAFVRMAEGGTMVTIMNRDKNMDTQEIAVDFKLTSAVAFG